MVRLVVLASGSGTNFENLVLASQRENLGFCIPLLLTDRPKAYALERAKNLNIPAFCVNYAACASKIQAEEEIIRCLRAHDIQFIGLAGFMRILSPKFLASYPKKIVNIHPAYLPEFPGKDGIGEAFRAKAVQTGVTVHYVDEGVDTGEIILQRRLAIHPEWDMNQLESAVHSLEYQLYPEALKKIFLGA